MDYEYLSNLMESHVIDMAAAGDMYCCVLYLIAMAM
jgi:hypothetical protein